MAKFIRPDGTVRVRIIGPGDGSSATYEADQLKRDMRVVGGKGTQVFLDHPGRREESDRPERSIRDMCAVSVADPVWEENGPKGPGPYTDVRVFKHYQPIIEEMGENIGVSIRAAGSVVNKMVNGVQKRVAERFTSGGFDFVTKAGAGGAVVPLTESARPGVSDFVEAFLAAHPQESETSERARAQFIEWATGTVPEQEEEMELKEKVTELETQNAALAADKQRLEEALVLREAQDIVAAEIAKESTLPEITRTRLTEALKTLTPLKEGKLDTEALKAAITQRVKDEKSYVESLTKDKRITGMGAARADDGGKAKLRESLIAMHIQNGEAKEKAERLADLAIAGR